MRKRLAFHQAARGDVIQASDGTRDVPARIFQRHHVGNHHDAGAVGPLNQHLHIFCQLDGAVEHVGYRCLGVRHMGAVG